MYRSSDDDSERPLLIVGLNDRVIALDRRSGEIRWERVLAPLGSTVEIAIAEGRVFAVTSNGRLYGLDYLDGTLLFEVKLRGPYTGRATMVVDGGYLFIAKGGEVLCADFDGGQVWHNGLPRKGVSSAALGFPGNLRQADKSS